MSQFETQSSSHSSTQSSSWWSTFSWEIQKRQLSDSKSDTETNEKWWSSFCSTQDEKEDKKEDKKDETTFSSMPTQTAVDTDDNKTDDDDHNHKDDEKISFYVKVGKHKKIKINEQDIV